jgi:ComF family protein
VDYGFPWDRLITEFKFRGNPAWAAHFAGVMRSAPWIEPALEHADCLIPMPLADARLRERGFNQSALLSQYLHPAKTQDNWLLRVQHTPAQSGLTLKERQQNLRHAFAMEPMNAHRARGLKVILIDDVMTSGATMAAAGTVLRRAGVAHLTALVFARTPANRPTA